MRKIPKRIVDVLADDSDVDYLGVIDKDTWFVVYCPEREGDWDNFQVAIGPPDNLKEVEVTGGMRYHNGLTIINIWIAERVSAGTFFFPPSHRKDREPMFNGQPIEVYE